MFHGILCWGRRLGGYGTDGTQEGRVDGSSKEEEFSTYLLYELLALFVKERCCGVWCSVLLLGTIFDGLGREWCMLQFSGFAVSKLFEGFGYVPRNGEVDFSVVVVPIDSTANAL